MPTDKVIDSQVTQIKQFTGSAPAQEIWGYTGGYAEREPREPQSEFGCLSAEEPESAIERIRQSLKAAVEASKEDASESDLRQKKLF